MEDRMNFSHERKHLWSIGFIKKNARGVGSNYRKYNDHEEEEKVYHASTKVKTVRPIPENKKRIVKVFNLVPSINNEEFYVSTF